MISIKKHLICFIALISIFKLKPVLAIDIELSYINNINNISRPYINKEATYKILDNVDYELTDYMKQKLNMYNAYIVDTKINNIDRHTNLNDNVQGVISYKYKEILITDYNNKKNKRILLHELGHAIDCYDELDNYSHVTPGKYSNTEEFKQIFESEKRELKSYSDELYFDEKIGEFFAESFSIYIDKPHIVEKNAPMLFDYFQKIKQLNPINGWQLNKSNKWYYVDNNTYKIGWYKTEEGKWYYFSEAGEMMTNVSIDGYFVGADGILII